MIRAISSLCLVDGVDSIIIEQRMGLQHWEIPFDSIGVTQVV